MRSIDLARELSLVGAHEKASLLAASEEEQDSVQEINKLWKAIGELMVEHMSELESGSGPDQDQLLWNRLCSELGLSRTGYWLIMCCAAVELHHDVAAAMSIVVEDTNLQLVSAFAFAHLIRSSLDIPLEKTLAEVLPGGLVSQLGLIEHIETSPGKPLTRQGIRATDHELLAILNDPKNLGKSRKIDIRKEEPTTRTAFDGEFVARSAQLLSERHILCLRSRSSRAARQFSIDLASKTQRSALLVTVREALPELSEIARSTDGLIVLDLSAFSAQPQDVFPLSYIEKAGRLHDRIVSIVAPSASVGTLGVVDVPALDHQQSHRVWESLLDAQQDIEYLGAKFRVNIEEARSALRETQDRLCIHGRSDDIRATEIARTIRLQGSRKMGRLVQLVTSTAHLEHFVGPRSLKGQLSDIVNWHEATDRAFSDYGLPNHTELGRGLTCLFSGPSGTGKTFAAQCLANEIGLNLYRIDLSQVVSKYIGETEKALSQVFDEAEAGHGVLLFDEADALFGKRTEVKDAHDRYANVEVGYLLQRLEAYRGVAILTSNLRSNIDPAFTRRLRFVVEFPMPAGHLREQLWKQSLPDQQFWSADLDLKPFVENFNLSGGHIHNIGIAAAHLAASDQRGVLSRAKLVRATYRELEKAGLSRSPNDFGTLAQDLPEKGA